MIFIDPDRAVNIESIVDLTEALLSGKKRRHIVGGILLSVPLLFGGLAITAVTTKEDENEQ